MKILTLMAKLLKPVKYLVPPEKEPTNGTLREELTQKLKVIVGDKYDLKVYEVAEKRIPNAFTFPSTKKIYYTTALENILTEKELLAILIHEFGHIDTYFTSKRNYVEYPLLSLFLASYIATIVSSIILLIKVTTNTVKFFISSLAFSFIMTMFLKWYREWYHLPEKMREEEFLADSYATKYGYGVELASALDKMKKEIVRLINQEKKKICSHNQVTEHRCDLFISQALEEVDMDSNTHPSFTSRIQKLNNQVKKLAPIQALHLLNKLADKKLSVSESYIKTDDIILEECIHEVLNQG